jgi:hypothetical protein
MRESIAFDAIVWDISWRVLIFCAIWYLFEAYAARKRWEKIYDAAAYEVDYQKGLVSKDTRNTEQDNMGISPDDYPLVLRALSTFGNTANLKEAVTQTILEEPPTTPIIYTVRTLKTLLKTRA